MNLKKVIFIFSLVFFSGFAFSISAHQPVMIYLQKDNNSVQIANPEISRAFYDDLKGKPRDYFIDSSKDFDLYINLLVPAGTNPDGKYSAKVFDNTGKEIAFINGADFSWQQYYESFGRDYYYKGPEFDKKVSAGKYKIEVYSKDNLGKYTLAVGKTESFDVKSVLNTVWQLPLLKLTFFKSDVLQFFLTPFGIGAIGALGGLIILILLINYIISVIKERIKHNMAKTLLLTSGGMDMKEQIVKLLQKPAYDVTVAFITTASKNEEDISYVENDLNIMKEIGFNVEELDIDGKTEFQIMSILKLKDIIFVEGGNTYFLLNAMRKCNFEKVLRKLLKQGIVYIGASAGSIVAGKTIETSSWKSDEPNYGVKNLKGLNLVPFNIFVHYLPEHAEIIKQKIKNPKKRLKKLKILTDGQAILVQGNEVDLIGEGEQIIV